VAPVIIRLLAVGTLTRSAARPLLLVAGRLTTAADRVLDAGALAGCRAELIPPAPPAPGVRGSVARPWCHR
jgi:hypothetical protein